MAELGTVASIVGVAGAGFRLSLILNAISCEVTQAPVEIHYISKTVTLFALMLKQTGTAFQAADPVHSRDAVEAAKQLADHGTRVFDEINEMLDRVRSKNEDVFSKASAQQRMKWCFKKNRINYLLGQLESLKLSLCLMLQMLQLGRMMAATSRSDTPEVVRDKTAAIQQERAEAQNTVIVRYREILEIEKLFTACEKDNSTPGSPVETRDETDNDSQVTIQSSEEYRPNMSMDRLPTHSLGDVIDQMLKQMCHSSKDMVRVSDQVVDALLEKWTKWREVREQRQSRYFQGKYTPTVHNLQEDDMPYHERYHEREDSPRGYYLEGTTTDWRKPNSAAARQEYTQRKKQYAGYQPSISAQSSDQEDSPGSNASKKRNTKRHIINSSSDSSDSGMEKRHPKPSVKFQPGPPLERSIPPQAAPNQSTPPSAQMPSRMPPSPAQSVGSKPPVSPPYVAPYGSRPYATPDQNTYHHHSVSMPLPPIYTHNAPTPYGVPNPQSVAYNHSPYYIQPGGPPPPRTYGSQSNRMAVPSRPISREGKGGHSPSRLSQEMPRDQDWDRERFRDRDKVNDRDRERYRDRDRDGGRYETKPKENKTKALREGATKGLLGGLALGSFIEVLEGLSI